MNKKLFESYIKGGLLQFCMGSMSLCRKLSKVMHSKDKVQLTGMHDHQGLDGS